MFMRVRGFIAVFGLAFGALWFFGRDADGPTAHAQPKPAAKPVDSVAKIVTPFLTKHCVTCHGATKKKADLELHVYTDEKAILKARKTWTSVLNMIQAGEMPPSGRPKPALAEAETFAKAVHEIFERHDRSAKRDPGRVTMRRLNRVEYNNTVRDLVGIDFPVGDDFPSDDVGHGFDNIGDVLTISPLHMERYMAAAETIMRQAILVGDAPKPVVRSQQGKFLEPAIIPVGKNRPLYTKGPLHTPFNLAAGGDCKIGVRLIPEQAGDEPVKFAILLDGKEVKRFESSEKKKVAKSYEVALKIDKGNHRVGVTVLNEYKDPKDEKVRRGILVEVIQLIGPMDTRPESHMKLLTAPDKLDKAGKTKHVLNRFVTAAYRRPPTAPEIDRLVKLAAKVETAGESWEASISLAMQAVLVSPKFLFRVELDSRSDLKDAHPIDDYQLASRLSYFLWSTMPDKELFDLAEKKQLHANVAAQVKRMLADPRAKALTENFASQWLQLRPLRAATPDPKIFPDFNDNLRKDMLKETDLFFAAILKEDRSILDLIDGKFTFLNERMARHYGIKDTNGNQLYVKAVAPEGKAIKGEEFVRVNLTPTNRGGVLTQASVLTVTSNPTRTSPVKRGRWVLEQILGTPPPPPPPDVPELDGAKQTKGTLRERMEQHRANAACAGCHARMDPIGFAFENFNGIGKFRNMDGDATIDASGELPGGQKFKGPAELQKILKGKKELFSRCLTEKMLTYAVGRGLDFYDKPAIDGILAALSKNEYRFSTLITAIATSDPFRLRRGKDQE